MVVPQWIVRHEFGLRVLGHQRGKRLLWIGSPQCFGDSRVISRRFEILSEHLLQALGWLVAAPLGFCCWQVEATSDGNHAGCVSKQWVFMQTLLCQRAVRNHPSAELFPARFKVGWITGHLNLVGADLARVEALTTALLLVVLPITVGALDVKTIACWVRAARYLNRSRHERRPASCCRCCSCRCGRGSGGVRVFFCAVCQQ